MEGEFSPLKRRVEAVIASLVPRFITSSSSEIIFTRDCSGNFPKDINRASDTKIFIRALLI